jgi:hypothetical protein
MVSYARRICGLWGGMGALRRQVIKSRHVKETNPWPQPSVGAVSDNTEFTARVSAKPNGFEHGALAGAETFCYSF